MSKQSEAKEAQGYLPRGASCKNCAHFQSEILNVSIWFQEKNIRCGLGGFKVLKNATCNSHKLK